MRATVAGITLPQRIKRVRAHFGESQAVFGQRFGVDQSTVSKWEKGRQVPESHHMDLFAEIEIEAHQDGAGDNAANGAKSAFTLVPVVGDIGAGAAVYPVEGERSSRAVDYVRAARGFGAVEALRVRGNSMWPAYRDGDTVFIENKLADFPLARDKEYILELEDGRVLLKTVEPNQDGTYTLLSYNGPAEAGVKVRSARKVRYVRKD